MGSRLTFDIQSPVAGGGVRYKMLDFMQGITDKVVVITGASSGIGEAT